MSTTAPPLLVSHQIKCAPFDALRPTSGSSVPAGTSAMDMPEFDEKPIQIPIEHTRLIEGDHVAPDHSDGMCWMWARLLCVSISVSLHVV